MSRDRLPPGFIRCDLCGGVNGTTFAKFLARNPYALDDSDYDPESRVEATCRCHGPLCRGCGVNRIHRPISGVYYEDINRVLHVPYFAAGAKCESCRSSQRLEDLRAFESTRGANDKAVHVPFERRPGASARHALFHNFQLGIHRTVWIHSVVVMPTYASLLSGLPDPDTDAELILRSRRRARTLWGDRLTHVIQPGYEYATDSGRTYLRMPPMEFHAWLGSGPIDNSEKPCSQVAVVWFGRYDRHLDLYRFVERELQSLQWDRLAEGCDS